MRFGGVGGLGVRGSYCGANGCTFQGARGAVVSGATGKAITWF